MRKVGFSSFKTAAYATARGHAIVGTERDGRRVTFIFEVTPSLEDDLELFRFSNPPVPIHSVFAAEARLKSLIFDGGLSGGGKY